jgi:hypothetical protein
VIGEASTLEQHLSTRRDLLSDDRINESYITSENTAIIRTPEAGPDPNEVRPPGQSDIASYLTGDDANAGMQSSQFANSAGGSLVLPTQVVPMDLNDEHPGASNTQSLHGSPMDDGSAPLDSTDHSSQMAVTEGACLEQSVQNRPKACCTNLIKPRDLRPSQTSSRRVATPNASHR